MEDHDTTVRLADGRVLGLKEIGEAGKAVLFYFHGFPGSRWEASLLARPSLQASVRLIGIDRPGIGLSTRLTHRRLLDWPKDVVELADYLGIDRFSVVALSGGAPYALACALHIPHRLNACGIVAGAGPVVGVRSQLSRILPWLTLPLLRSFFHDERSGARSLERFARRWPQPDQDCLNQSGIAHTLVKSLTEAFRQGTNGPAQEAMLLGGNWGFALGDIAFPRIHLWHGELDSQIPVGTTRRTAKALGSSRAVYYPNEGHISLVVNRGEEIVRKLTGDL